MQRYSLEKRKIRPLIANSMNGHIKLGLQVQKVASIPKGEGERIACEMNIYVRTDYNLTVVACIGRSTAWNVCTIHNHKTLALLVRRSSTAKIVEVVTILLCLQQWTNVACKHGRGFPFNAHASSSKETHYTNIYRQGHRQTYEHRKWMRDMPKMQ